MVTNLVSPETRVFGLIFSTHGNILAGGAAFPDGRTVPKLWAVDGWREISLREISLKGLVEFELSPDERTLAIGYRDGTAAWWNLATGQRKAFFDCHCASGVRVRFSPDGRLFATAGLDGLITVWDVATRRPKPIGRGYRNALHDLVFSLDGQRLITTGSSPKGLVKLWDVATGRDVATLPGEPGRFAHIGFSPDGNTLFATSLEGTNLLWRAPSWQEIEALEKRQSAP
jgi:WD40 repeat protein